MGLFNREIRKNVMITILTQILIAISFLVMLGVISRIFSKEEMGLYGNYKSLLQSLFFLYTFGMDIGLARYLGFYDNNREMQDRCFSTVVVLYLVLLIGSTIILCFLGNFLTRHFLGGDKTLFYYTVLALILIGAFKIVYTFYQGTRHMVAANFLQLFVLAGGNFLLTALILGGIVQTLKSAILILSIVMAIALVPLMILIRHQFHWQFNFSEIIRYSLPRAPHIFLAGIMLTFGIILASYYYSYSLAGDFTVTTRLFRILGMGAYGFNMVLLPEVAAMVGAGKHIELSLSLDRYGNLIMHIGLVGMFACYVLSPLLIRLWLAEQYMSAVPILQIFSFSIPLYLYYLMFRSAIHGMDERPVQLYIDLVSFAVLLFAFFGLKSWVDNPAILISITMAISFSTNGLLSIYYLNRYASVPFRFKLWGIHGLVVLTAIVLSHWNLAGSALLFITGEAIFAFMMRREWRSLFHV
ncbi:MAG: hypothetical protein GXO70_11750 [Acidobacteria bacterium]|nr:hypothetical protein [Acidobacteriota bacterium]